MDNKEIIRRNMMYREAILAIQCATLAKEAGEPDYFNWIEEWHDGTLMEDIVEGMDAKDWFDQQYPIIQALLPVEGVLEEQGDTK